MLTKGLKLSMKIDCNHAGFIHGCSSQDLFVHLKLYHASKDGIVMSVMGSTCCNVKEDCHNR